MAKGPGRRSAYRNAHRQSRGSVRSELLKGERMRPQVNWVIELTKITSLRPLYGYMSESGSGDRRFALILDLVHARVFATAREQFLMGAFFYNLTMT